MTKQTVWVDADNFPTLALKETLKLTSLKRVGLVCVANREGVIAYGQWVQVEKGADKADNYILQHLQKSHIVLTQDLLLAQKVLKQGGQVVNGYGALLTLNSIESRLIERNLALNLSGAEKTYRCNKKNYGLAQLNRFIQTLKQVL